MNTLRFLASVLGSVLATQALAYEHLIGEYTGKVRESVGYGVNIDDSCTVTISKSEAFWAGAIVFEIQNVGKILVELQHVRKSLEENTETVRLVSHGSTGKPTESVSFTLNSAGKIKSLKLLFKGGKFGQDRSVLCVGLLTQQG